MWWWQCPNYPNEFTSLLSCLPHLTNHMFQTCRCIVKSKTPVSWLSKLTITRPTCQLPDKHYLWNEVSENKIHQQRTSQLWLLRKYRTSTDITECTTYHFSQRSPQHYVSLAFGISAVTGTFRHGMLAGVWFQRQLCPLCRERYRKPSWNRPRIASSKDRP